jgi:hypothetical protein
MAVNLILKVNDAPINTDHFVAGFIEHTITAMVASLEGAGKADNMSLSIDGEIVTIELNGIHLQTNVFAGRMIKSTIMGMLVPLKGVKDIKKVSIVIQK